MTPRGVFVTGTDTGVGKTLVACGLIRQLRARGIDTAAIKPIETGVDAGGPADAIALRHACGDRDPIDDVCPERFALPAAPSVAAAAEHRRVDRAAIRAAFERLRRSSDFIVAEGAGGLLVPIEDGFDMLDLALEFALPALLVARAALGTINHTRLSLEIAEQRGLPVAGVVISHADGVVSAADEANLAALRAMLGPGLLGEIPPLFEVEPRAWLPEALQAIDLDRLWSRLDELSATG